ncbi:hypothetical protein J4464_02590 [Candidatus Woesearchaeota archaeon]|nr:hypothetical protein [Candidatus Woesearchaeota archaeon]
MATEVYVDLKDFDAWNMANVPDELAATASGGRLQVGTCFGNSDRRATLSRLVQESCGEWTPETRSPYIAASIDELRSSDKPHFSKWSHESPIEFFNTALRFSWHIPLVLQEAPETPQTAEEFAKAMFDFWNSILSDMTPVYHSSLYPISTWKALSEAIIGDYRYMESSRIVQGTVLGMPTEDMF